MTSGSRREPPPGGNAVSDELLKQGQEIRRSVLGDEYVNKASAIAPGAFGAAGDGDEGGIVPVWTQYASVVASCTIFAADGSMKSGDGTSSSRP
jgi:hypothetical protein